MPFIHRPASGLPTPQHALFTRDSHPLGRCGGHGAINNTWNSTTNGTFSFSRCNIFKKPAGVIYVVLEEKYGNDIEKLGMMLRSLDRNFNHRSHYPVAIIGFDMNVAKRTAIRDSTSSNLEFIDLSNIIQADQLPNFLDKSKIPDIPSCGYNNDQVIDRLRNRWLAYEGMKLLSKHYDWYWRLAYDSLLTEPLKYDPFLMLASQNKTYGYITILQDDANCIQGLWEATQTYAKEKQVSSTFLDAIQERSVFSNGFEISHRSVWQSAEYSDFFDFMDHQGGMLYNRWTELNIHTMALSLFASPKQLHRFNDVGFKHYPFIDQHGSTDAIKRAISSHWEGHPIAVETDANLSSLFAARRWGFLGADVATSFRLPAAVKLGSYVWLFGDTLLGTSGGSKRGMDYHSIIHNAMAFVPDGNNNHHLSPADVHFFWNVYEDGSPKEAFPHPDENGIYWPVGGLSVELHQESGSIDSKIIILVQRVTSIHRE